MDWGRYIIDNNTQNGTGYTTGLYYHALYKLYKRLKAANDPMAPQYLTKLQGWATGGCGAPGGGSFDGIMHMTACADLYELTMNAGLSAALKATRNIYNGYPATSKDHVWIHNTGDTGQVWGDTEFMALSFLTRYGAVMNDATVADLATHNITLAYGYLHDPVTGLLWHGYSENMPVQGSYTWTEAAGTNHSTAKWGRAMGWFVMASVMVLEEIPANDPNRPTVEKNLADLITALRKYQDPTSGRWYQVVDMGGMGGDWLETSCSAMYTYGTYWAVKHGLVDSSFCDVARKGLGDATHGVIQELSMNAGSLVSNTCPGTNVLNSPAQYIARAHPANDPHGIGSVLLMWEGLMEE
jgi:unsaturated rhamnogalacturonyl hydrolase